MLRAGAKSEAVAAKLTADALRSRQTVTDITAAAERDGFCLFDLDRSLAEAELIALAEELGEPLTEHAPELQQHAYDRVLLRLFHHLGKTNNTGLQPFSSMPITLHTELSRVPYNDQPDLILLYCEEVGVAHARTLLVPFSEVDQRLHMRDRRIISDITYDLAHTTSTLRVTQTDTYSYRDFHPAGLGWKSEITLDPVDVARAVDNLTFCMYSSTCRAVGWAPRRLLILNNRRFFHGREAGPQRPHLRRLWRIRTKSRKALEV